MIEQEEIKCLNEYHENQTIICGKDYLKCIDRFDHEEIDDRKTLEYAYESPEIFYPVLEDTNIKRRRKLLEELEQERILECRKDCYSDDDIERQYLDSTPVSFLVMGKPTVGEAELSALLAEHWNAVLVSPQLVIEHEISSGSRTGKCIEFNMNCGRGIGPEVILRLVEQRVKSSECQHRGFVLSGFPLIPNDKFLPEPLSSESAIFNVQEIFEEILAAEEALHQPSEVSLKGSKVSMDPSVKESAEDMPKDGNKTASVESVKKPPSHVSVKSVSLREITSSIIFKHTESFFSIFPVEKQLEFLFRLFPKPFVVIYITCGNLEIVHRLDDLRYDFNTGQEVSVRQESNVGVTFEDEVVQLYANADEYHKSSKFLFRMPYHHEQSVRKQLDEYNKQLLQVAEKKIMEMNPEHLIKLDGRLPALKMFSALRMRLKTLAFDPVLIPKKLSIDFEIHGEFGESPPPVPDVEPPEIAFNSLKRARTVGPMYKLQLSDWGYFCPVAMHEGRLVKGISERAHSFLNKIYFLSSEHAEFKFRTNPRVYLRTPPHPVCRIFVMGPKYSGKSIVAKCLSYLYDGTLLHPGELEREYKQRKLDAFLETARTAAINKALNELNERRKQDKDNQIEEWILQAKNILLEAVNANESTTSINNEDNFVKLEQMNLPTATEDIKTLLETPDKIRELVPKELVDFEPEPANVFDQFVTKYVENEVRSARMEEDTTLTSEETVEMYKNAIKGVESENMERTGQRGGWVIDGFPPDVELVRQLGSHYVADDVVCLRDEDPENVFLLAKYARQDYAQFKDFKKFFKDVEKLSVAMRCSSTSSMASSRLEFIEKIVEEMQEDALEYDPDADIEMIKQKRSNRYAEQLSDFNEKWNLFKSHLEEFVLNPIEVDIVGKNEMLLLKEAVLQIENKYRVTASVVNEEDKLEEFRDFGGIPIGGTGEEAGEFDHDETENMFQQNRRFGNTGEYCPVAYQQFNVLWKGTEQFAARFQDRLYFLSSQAALDLFIHEPRKYLLSAPPKKLPPPRICVVGPIASGKTTIARSLSRNFGLCYVDYQKILLEKLDLNCKTFEDAVNAEMADVNHHDAILIIKDYLLVGKDLPEELLGSILYPLWHEPPYNDIGIVIDNFPARHGDFMYMITHALIPDMVVELRTHLGQVQERVFPDKLEKWHIELQEKIRLKEEQNRLVHQEWSQLHSIKYYQLYVDAKQKRILAAREARTYRQNSPVDSKTELFVEEEELLGEDWFIYAPEDEAEDIEEILRKLEVELPEPTFNDVWETEEEFLEKLETLTEARFYKDEEFVYDLRVSAEKESMPWIAFTTENPAEKVFFEVARTIDKIKFRNSSAFERVYEILPDTAEKLLAEGYYLFSRFGRTCPVQVRENTNRLQLYLPAERSMELRPVIYRRYIYFLNGDVSLSKFKDDPLYYTETNGGIFPLMPLKVAVIGPPKSGKSVLAGRFERDFGLRMITRGQAIRRVLAQLGDSVLAQDVRGVLQAGWTLTDEMVARCVEALTYDASAICQGYVLDGFPNSSREFEHLIRLGVVPYIILDLQTDLEKIKDLCEIPANKTMRNFSYKLIKYRHDRWMIGANLFRQWNFAQYQNLQKITHLENRWYMWEQAKSMSLLALAEFHTYYNNRMFDIVHNLQSLCVYPKEFYRRQSVFKTFCPCCLAHNDELTNGGVPPDRQGLMQFRQNYYYICSLHQTAFMQKPNWYTSRHVMDKIPADIPKVLCDVEDIRNPYQDGLCIVCFWDAQPRRVLRQGNEDIAVSYKYNIYLFCSTECMLKFLHKPQKYWDIQANYRESVPIEVPDTLPTLGYLEQYVSVMVTKALVNTEIHRPVHPFLTEDQSAVMNVGLFLKMHNPNTPENILPVYDQAKELFVHRCEQLKKLIRFFKSRTNPYVCVDGFEVDECETRRPSVMIIEDQSMTDISIQNISARSSLTGANYILDVIMDRITMRISDVSLDEHLEDPYFKMEYPFSVINSAAGSIHNISERSSYKT